MDRSRVENMFNVSDAVKTGSILTFLAGVWLVLAPSILTYLDTIARTNDLWIGIAIGAVSLIRYARPQRWLGWVTTLLGIWLLVAPFVLGYVSNTTLWNSVILGLLVTGVSLWSLGKGEFHGLRRPRISV